MLDRYKKKGGFIQLLTLIETSGKQKQETFLGLIAQENKVWEEGIRKRILTLDRILNWDAQYRAEIFSRVQPLTLATVLHGMPQEQIDTILGCLGNGDKRKIMGVIAERNPTPQEKSTCVMKIITEVRQFCMGGIIKLDKADPDIAIAENIEDLLNNQAANGPVSTELSFPDTAPAKEAAPGELRFDDPKTRPAATTSSEDVEFLKKKVNQLVNENNTLKHDLNVARNKLEQIRKIA